MPLFSRPDGKLATDVPAFRRMMPFLMPSRNESAVYYEQEIDLTQTRRFIDRYNATHEKRITVFHVFLWAAVRTLHERPRLNRFVIGNRIYQRDGVWISYSAKKELSDGSPIVVLKRRFDPSMTFEELVDFVHGDVKTGKSDERSHVDKELSLFLRLPALLLSLGVRLVRWLDSVNLLPGSFIVQDPMYASMFVANLGSVKLESAFHHLYEYGNIPLFAAVGRSKQVLTVDASGRVVTRTVCQVKYSFDERIEDGLYCARGLELTRGMIEDPTAHGAMAPVAAVVPFARAG
ncbi:MAG: hypothetical protein ACYC8T_05715 [Myxococcaceae bacterium]